MGQNNKMCICLTTSKTQIVLKELREGVVKGHFAADIISKKKFGCRIQVANFIHEYSYFCEICDNYHKIGGLKTKSLAKLVTTLPK